MNFSTHPLLVFADDWGRHPSSAQHLVRCLLPRHEVHWINTIGTRKPRLSWSTLRRGVEKLRHWTQAAAAAAALPAGLHVHNPRMWPWFSRRHDRWLNRRLLLRALEPVVASLPTPPLVITTLPITADLVGRLPTARWIYYCVDDFTQWPGLDGDALRAMEADLVARADVVIAVSRTLQERLKGMGRDAPLLTHGVDLDFWKADGVENPFPQFQELPRPRALFWGVIDRRMDVGLVRRLAAELEGGTVVLVGPQDQPDPALLRLDRVVLRPPLPLEQLPALAQQADVLIMPYADLPVTRAMQPLKLKEYLATGRPVVVRDLPANRDWADCLDLAATPDAFVGQVRTRLAEGVSLAQLEARQRLMDEGWAAKARLFEHYWTGAVEQPLASGGRQSPGEIASTVSPGDSRPPLAKEKDREVHA